MKKTIDELKEEILNDKYYEELLTMVYIQWYINGKQSTEGCLRTVQRRLPEAVSISKRPFRVAFNCSDGILSIYVTGKSLRITTKKGK